MANDSVEVLAKLLSNAALREAFINNPVATLDRLDITGAARDVCLGLSTTQLVEQARIMIKKRMREVSQIAPSTMHCLGERAAQVFTQFADTFWPTGHLRHVVDACQFCEYLKDRRYTINNSEYHRIKFQLDNSRWRIRIIRDSVIAGRYNPVVQFQFRFRKKIHERWFYFSMTKRRTNGRGALCPSCQRS